MSFSEFETSLKARSALDDLIVKIIDRERPKYRYGVIDSIDRANSIAHVIYDGETVTSPVQLGRVQEFAIGQHVRVAGLRTDRYIDEGFSGPQKFQTWNMHGPLYVTRFDDWTYFRDFQPNFLITSLTVPGSTDTTYQFLLDGVAQTTVSLGSGQKAVMTDLVPFDITMVTLVNFLAINLTAVGTGAQGLLVEVYGR